MTDTAASKATVYFKKARGKGYPRYRDFKIRCNNSGEDLGAGTMELFYDGEVAAFDFMRLVPPLTKGGLAHLISDAVKMQVSPQLVARVQIEVS